MALRLRTRMFLGVGALVAVSVLVSAVLSRQLTLVEVRQVVSTRTAAPHAVDVLERATTVVGSSDPLDLDEALAVIEEASGRQLVVFDRHSEILAASNPALASAEVRELSRDGTFAGTIRRGEVAAAVEIHGAPTRQARTRAGVDAWILVLPPVEDESSVATVSPTVPGWVWSTAAVAIVAVPLVFAMSRRILDPVTALTLAARRMRAGDFSVTVEPTTDDELGELTRAFNDMSSRLAENERLRKQMVSDVAHELRSPVTNLRCTLEAIQDGLTSPDRASMDLLHEETLFLQRIIADLEDLALADAGQLRLHTAAVDLDALVRRLVHSMAAVTGAPIVVEADAGAHTVQGDEDRLEQVLRNLVTNARTHTPVDGRITIRLSTQDAGVTIDVSDTGAGIDPAHLPHVFERFYRADRSRTRATGGAGLGLAIARQLVSAHGGTLEATSAGRGQGSTFSVRLPSAS